MSRDLPPHEGPGQPGLPGLPGLPGQPGPPERPTPTEEPPPLLGSWANLYALVLGNLALLILLFWLLTRMYG